MCRPSLNACPNVCRLSPTMWLNGLALSATVDLALGTKVLAYFESNASVASEIVLRPVKWLGLGDFIGGERRSAVGQH